jgi:ATP adenylyltransferase
VYKEVITHKGMQFALCLEKGQIRIKTNLENNFTKEFSMKLNPFMGKLKKRLVITRNLNEKHMLLLNKYPVLDNHLLIVAKPDHFELQDVPLDYLDMEAILMTFTLLENPVIFFNGGESAGASQPHKHMQAVPMASF